MLGSAESSRETWLLDHRRETPLRLAAAPLARHFYCRDLRAINQPVVGPSARLLPFPQRCHPPPAPLRPSRSVPSPYCVQARTHTIPPSRLPKAGPASTTSASADAMRAQMWRKARRAGSSAACEGAAEPRVSAASANYETSPRIQSTVVSCISSNDARASLDTRAH